MMPAEGGHGLAERMAWMRDGTSIFLRAMAALDDDLADSTGLAGWTGAHLLAHVAANAEALGHLATWARTGNPTPMYSSPQQRNRDIEEGARRPAQQLREWVKTSALALDASLTELTDQQWGHQVRTAQGREVDATQIPWMRAREVMVHSVDLGQVTFDDLPKDFLIALTGDIVQRRSGKPGPALTLGTDDGTHRWELPGSGDPATVRGTLADIAAYLAGRPPTGSLDGAPTVPPLPPWL